MKTIIVTMALMLSLTAGAEEKNDTTVNYNGKRFVIDDDAPETKVSIFTSDGGTLKKTRETAYVNDQEIERIYVTSPFTPSSYTNNPFGMVQPTIWYGWRRMTGKALGNWGESEGIHTKDGGSFDLGITLGELTVPFGRKNKYGMSAAFQISYVRQYFSNNTQPYNEGRHMAFTDISQTPAENNYLHYTVIRIPTLLMISDKNMLSNHLAPLQGGLGLALEYRIDARFHFMPGSFGDPVNKHARIYHWGLLLNASTSIGPFKVTAYQDLLPLFKTTNGHKAYSTTIALGITIGDLIKKNH